MEPSILMLSIKKAQFVQRRADTTEMGDSKHRNRIAN
jgi:hypothetical protein